MNRCLVCFNKVEESINHNLVCGKCLSKLEIIEKKYNYNGVEILVLYKYNDFFKEVLYRYKGCYDYYLKDVFLSNFAFKLKRKYRNMKIICAPSFEADDIKRGFNHVKEIAKILDFEIIDCLKKTKEYKQSDQKLKDRKNIQKYIEIDKSKLNMNDRVLIFDDVATSLSTIKTIIHLLPTNIDKKVLILASNCRFMIDDLI